MARLSTAAILTTLWKGYVAHDAISHSSANSKQDLIHVSEAKVGRKLVDWYLRNLARTY